MPTCVYCQRPDPPCGFNREHVIPEALGRFHGAEVVTLTREVCKDCNQYFGDTLDRMLTRDSYEALLRIEHGLKEPAGIPGMFKKRLTVRLPSDGTNWGGALLRLRPHPEGGARPIVDLTPQVGFELADGGGWEYFAEEDLRAKPGIAERVARRYGKRRVILFDSDEAREHLLATLSELGIPFKKEDEFRGFPPFARGEVETEVQARFDNYLARAVCKIAFNYMTKTQGAELALRSEFDATRRYVRYGEGKGGAFLTFDADTRFRNAAGQTRRKTEHALMLDWNGNRRELIGRVHLFGETRYAVRLCTRWDGIWRQIMSGHVFDLESMEVTQVHVTRIAPPWAAVPVR